MNFSLQNAQKSDVIYYLFKNATQEDLLELTEDNISQLDKKLPTKIFLHGFTTNITSPWYPLLKTQYFIKGPHNIIYIDWSKAGDLTYPESAANVDPVGGFIADFLITTKIPLAQIHIIGHSLGSQLASYIGKHVIKKTAGKKIARITALDPAGPGFEKLPSELRLNEQDADFVDVIHTDLGYYGFNGPMGHVDFYPNGGKNQPGCPERDVQGIVVLVSIIISFSSTF